MYPLTAQDMYDVTLELMNKSNTTSITPDEWNIWANTLQLEHVLNLYGQYQKDQGIMDKLNPLIIDLPINNTGAAISSQEIFALPSDYLRLLNVSFRLNYVNDTCVISGPGLKFLPASLVSDDEYTIVDDNPYKRAKTDRLLYYQAVNALGQRIIKLKTGSTSYGLEAKIRYLRYPKNIDVYNSGTTGDCELPTDVRNDICHVIARRIIEAIESGRYPQIAGETNQILNN